MPVPNLKTLPTATRERLLHLLAEASELEHNLLCSYLFAYFSLKRRLDEGLSEAEHAAVQRWRKLLLSVCVEEMVHLTQVANLTASLGAAPHFNRPNLPAAPGYHPASIVVALTPFNVETLKHFVFLERPDSADCHDSDGFSASADAAVERGGVRAKLIPVAPEYETIGEFYSVLRRSLESFAAQQGDGAFVSDVYQLEGALIESEDLLVVRTLDDALLAIDRIVEQGEGGSDHAEDSHFARFTDMLEELDRLQSARPAFEPSRNVGANPVMRPPQDTERMPVKAEHALACLDAFNAVYWMMLRTLTALYASGSNTTAAEALVEHMLSCMHLLGELADPLTEQVAGDEPGLMAGPSFTMYRHSEGPANLDCALHHLVERTSEICVQVSALPIDEGRKNHLDQALRRMAKKLSAAAGS